MPHGWRVAGRWLVAEAGGCGGLVTGGWLLVAVETADGSESVWLMTYVTGCGEWLVAGRFWMLVAGSWWLVVAGGW